MLLILLYTICLSLARLFTGGYEASNYVNYMLLKMIIFIVKYHTSLR